jgi:hypothetical protein
VELLPEVSLPTQKLLVYMLEVLSLLMPMEVSEASVLVLVAQEL